MRGWTEGTRAQALKNEKAWMLTPGDPKGTPRVTNLPAMQRPWFDSWLGRSPREGIGQPTLVFLGSLGGSHNKESSCNVGDVGLIPGLGRCPGKGMATYCHTLIWRIPRTEEPGTLQSLGSQRVGHNWATFTFTCIKWDILLLGQGAASLYYWVGGMFITRV